MSTVLPNSSKCWWLTRTIRKIKMMVVRWTVTATRFVRRRIRWNSSSITTFSSTCTRIRDLMNIWRVSRKWSKIKAVSNVSNSTVTWLHLLNERNSSWLRIWAKLVNSKRLFIMTVIKNSSNRNIICRAIRMRFCRSRNV